MRQAPYVLLPASVGECWVSISRVAALGGFDSQADVNDLLSMSVCAMLWGWVKSRSRIHLNLELSLNSLPLTNISLDPNRPYIFSGRTGLDLDHLLANRRLLGLLVGQDQVRVEQLERGELRVHYC